MLPLIKNFSLLRWLWILPILFVLFACLGQDKTLDEAKNKPQYKPSHFVGTPIILSVLPVESPGLMYEKFALLKYYLEGILKRQIIIKIAKDYETAVKEIGEGRSHLAFLDPAVYCEARAKYKNNIIPLVSPIGVDGATSRSVLIVKNSSDIQRITDLKGKNLAIGNRQSSFSYLIPLAMLNEVGIKTKDFSGVDFLYREDRVALSVLIGYHHVGAISESVAKKYLNYGLKIIKKSEAIPSFVLCASAILPNEVKNDIIKALVSLKDTAILSSIDSDLSGFVAALDRDFDGIRFMIKNLTGKDYVEYSPKTIKFAILPLYSPITLYNRYDPLMRYLTTKTGYEFKLLIPKDFEDFMQIVKNRKADFSYQNPYIFALIDKETDIKPLVTTVGEDTLTDEHAEQGDKFRGVIITRDDSPIRNIKDLRNKKVLITSPKSAGGYLSQRITLMENGIDTEKDMKIIDAKKQENVIIGIYRGEADAGFIREAALVVWRDAIDMKQIKILARTHPLPNWPVAQCSDRNPSLGSKVMSLLIHLREDKILGAAKIKEFKQVNEAELEVLKGY